MRKTPDLTPYETELLIDVAEGRITDYFLLSQGQKSTAFKLQRRGLLLTGKRDKRVPLALTDEGKRELQRYLLAR